MGQKRLIQLRFKMFPISSIFRFRDREVGTTWKKIVSDSILYPSVTVCVSSLVRLHAGNASGLPDSPDPKDFLLALGSRYVEERNSRKPKTLYFAPIWDRADLSVAGHSSFYAEPNRNSSLYFNCSTFNPTRKSPAGYQGRVCA